IIEETFKQEKAEEQRYQCAAVTLLKSSDPALVRQGEELESYLQKRVRIDEPFSVLLPSSKNPESAFKTARKFYQQRGPSNVKPLGERVEEVENTTRYCNECGSLLTPPKQFNLMFKTCVGPVESEDNVAYLRPETAQAIFAQFKNVLEVSRQRVPFGICQIGKAFRNEINPRNFTFRSREFEQMELEFFIRPDDVVQKQA